MSLNELELVFEFRDGLVLEGVLERVHGPLIVEEIRHRLPIDGKSAFMRGEMKITLGLNKGNLKPTKDVKRGDVAYMPLGDSLCIYTKDMQTFSQVNVIGRIVSSSEILDKLETVKRGSQVRITHRGNS